MDTSDVGHDPGSELRYGTKFVWEVPVPNWLVAAALPPTHLIYSVPLVGATKLSPLA
jgi:hypothetical protein